MKRQNGITLIALVITIIVLLILAGVSISMVTGDNGIATKANLAKTETDKANKEEEEDLQDALDYINENSPTDEETLDEENIILGNTSLEENTVSMTNTTAWTGSGTETAPYEIASLEQLAYLAKQVNSGNKYTGIYFKLTADIDASGAEWVPIGNNKDRYFDGIFKGEAYTITNFGTTSPYNYRGVFGFTGSNSKITDLTINGATFGNTSVATSANGDFAGAIVGYSRGIIDNCHIKNAAITGNTYVGGIAGYNNGTVKNCSVDSVTITGTDKVDGIIGINEGTITDSTIQNSTVNGV